MSLAEQYNKANIFLGLIDYELNSRFWASHLVDYISVHIRFDLERYSLNIVVGLDEYLFKNVQDIKTERYKSVAHRISAWP